MSPHYRRSRDDDLERTYEFAIHQDLWSHRLFPFWATATLGIAMLGEPGSGVWRSRSRERLEAKAIKWAKRDALRRGNRDPIIEFVDAD